MNKKSKFNQICKDIKSLKIQSAKTLAEQAFFAYKLFPTEKSKKILLSLRPTEPMLQNIFNRFSDFTYADLIKKLDEDQDKINKQVYKLINNNDIIFTHCHATSVTTALIYSKKKGKRFEVYNTETRPLFQGRKTSLELSKAGIKVTQFVDSAALIALTNSGKHKKADLVLIGSDAITKKGVINKVGSGMFAEISRMHNIPFYIVSDSLKFTKKKIKIEKRNPFEIWKNHKIHLVNPAFEFIPKKYISGIVSELGNLSFNDFLKKV